MADESTPAKEPAREASPKADAAPNYERLYEREQQRRRTMTGVSLVVGIIAIAATVTAVVNHQSPTLNQRRFAAVDTVSPRSAYRGGMMSGRPMAGRRGTSITQFLNSDGSVDSTAVTNLLNQYATNNKTLLIDRLNTAVDRAAATGQITAPQAKALHAAIGTSTTASAQS